MSVKLPTEHHLEFLSLKGGCTGSSESTLVKMPHCWKSHIVAQIDIISYIDNLSITSLWDVAVVNDTTIIITFPDNLLQFIYVAPRLQKGHKIDLGSHCYGADQFHHGIDVIDETIYLPCQDGHIMLLDLNGRTKRVLGALFSKPILRYC